MKIYPPSQLTFINYFNVVMEGKPLHAQLMGSCILNSRLYNGANKY
jgi:hypothetical protein